MQARKINLVCEEFADSGSFSSGEVLQISQTHQEFFRVSLVLTPGTNSAKALEGKNAGLKES